MDTVLIILACVLISLLSLGLGFLLGRSYVIKQSDGCLEIEDSTVNMHLFINFADLLNRQGDVVVLQVRNNSSDYSGSTTNFKEVNNE